MYCASQARMRDAFLPDGFHESKILWAARPNPGVVDVHQGSEGRLWRITNPKKSLTIFWAGQ
jgi:hypothetical protein